MAPVSSKFASHPYETALVDMMEAYGGQWPPRPSFANWPQSLQVYQQIADGMPQKLASLMNVRLFRQWMKNELQEKVELERVMEDIDSHLAHDDAILLGFTACLSFLACSYRWGTAPPTDEERQRNYLTFPEHLWKPLTKIHDFYGLLYRGSTFTLNVANCVYDAKGNPVDMRFCFNHDPEIVQTEKNFFLSFLEVENSYKPVLHLMSEYLLLTEEARRSKEKAEQLMNRRVELLNDIRKIMISVMKVFMKYMKEDMVSLKYWAKYVEALPAWNINDIQGGPSGSEALTFATIDEFLGAVGESLVYKSNVKKRASNPTLYRRCIEALDNDSRSYRFDSFLELPQDEDPVRIAYQDVVYVLYNWRLFHGKVGPRYLETSHATAGGAVDRVLGKEETLAERAKEELHKRSQETGTLLTASYKQMKNICDTGKKSDPETIVCKEQYDVPMMSLPLLVAFSVCIFAVAEYIW